MIVKRKTYINIHELKHETTRQKENKSQTKRNRGTMMARVRVLYTYATSRHCSDLLSVLDCDGVSSRKLSVFKTEKPAGTSRLLPDAKGMEELAATRLMRESTASRVRDILPWSEGAAIILREKTACVFCKGGFLPDFVAE